MCPYIWTHVNHYPPYNPDVKEKGNDMNTCNYLKKFEGTATLIRLVTSIDPPICASNDTVIQQRLTIIDNGAVSLISTARNKEIIESLNFDIERSVARDLIMKIARFFSKPVDNKRYPVVGNYDLTITNSDGVSYFYDGSLNNNYTIDGDNISEYFRSILDLPQLLVFEDHGRKKDLLKLRLSSVLDGALIELDAKEGTLAYRSQKCKLVINDEQEVKAILAKYGERILEARKHSSLSTEIWNFMLNAEYSYGEGLEFGGNIKWKSHYHFLDALLKEIRNLISAGLSSYIFSQDKSLTDISGLTDYQELCLVDSNDLFHPKWYLSCDGISVNDYVLVKDESGSIIIGQVVQMKREYGGFEVEGSITRIIKKL